VQLRRGLTMPSRLGCAGRWLLIRVGGGVCRCVGGERPPRRIWTPALHFSHWPASRGIPRASRGLAASRHRSDVDPPHGTVAAVAGLVGPTFRSGVSRRSRVWLGREKR
jgi:hypothetical protein